MEIKAKTNQKPSMRDYKILRKLGKGSFGDVFQVKKIADENLYALKSLNKSHLMKEQKQYQVFAEREILSLCKSQYLTTLSSTFQDDSYLYFIIEYIPGGNLSSYLDACGKLHVKEILYYAVHIIRILEYQRSIGVAHRDIKPENIMVDKNGMPKLVDFGTAKFFKVTNENQTHYAQIAKNKKKFKRSYSIDSKSRSALTEESFVGTAQYSSPELLNKGYASYEADLWAQGVILYKMATGNQPFYERTEYQVYQRIQHGDYKALSGFDETLEDLIKKLLVLEPTERIGSGLENTDENGLNKLKSHAFFSKIDWNNVDQMTQPKKKQNEVLTEHMEKIEKLDFGPKTFSKQNVPEKTKSTSNLQSKPQLKQSSSRDILKSISSKQDSMPFEGKPSKKMSSVSYENDVCLQSNAKRVKFIFVEIKGVIYLFDSGKIIFTRSHNNDQRKFDDNNITKIEIKNNTISIFIQQDKSTNTSDKRYQFKIVDGNMKDWKHHIKRIFQNINLTIS